ncbi:MAG: DEAD/DEAH box helicase, partial [Mucispirillum sp.]|nr:DEAD/DEAH box helicase [Mucispirillum sp.]
RKHISGGFIDKESGCAVISDMDIFGFTKRKPKPKKKDAFNTKLSDLEEGDYVVHVNHGIGIYQGIKHMIIAGSEGDFLSIMYEGEDLLYVPLHSIGQLQKYIGMQNQQPKLNSLKSSAWQKLKKYAKESAKHIAEDLLRLYAERKARKGYAFNDDGSLIEIFERNFEYTETEDQLSAIYDVYNDMESETPMERLVCGDVGFGKTEVAMRAACKAIACSKQAAVLVPTTILARQHYETFTERFNGLPVNIEFVSRFRTDKETKSIFNKVSEGTVDILIGTHKILSKDLSFKDLGLLIIDEEQRFGVSHKEKIASIKRNVDTLTLSATPIPRTLQLSLSGIRDMSIIETPPENRLPVVVKVIKGLTERIKAIKTELERGGQVFFLHNRVQDIQEAALEIKRELPLARVDYAHG